MDTSQTETLSLSKEASQLTNLRKHARLFKSPEYITFQRLMEICIIFSQSDPGISEDWICAREALFEILHSLFLTKGAFRRLGHFFLIDQLIEEDKPHEVAKKILQPSKICVNIPLSASRAGFISHYLNLAEEFIGESSPNEQVDSAARKIVCSFNTMWHTFKHYIEDANEQLSGSNDPEAFRGALTSFAKDADLGSHYCLFADNWQDFAQDYLLSKL